MEEQNHKNYLQFSPLPLDWLASNASGSHFNFESDQHYIMAEGSGSCQWMHSQPKPQNYVRFLSETVHAEIQKQMAYDVSAHCPTLQLPYPSQMVNNHSALCTQIEFVQCGTKISREV